MNNDKKYYIYHNNQPLKMSYNDIVKQMNLILKSNIEKIYI